MIDIDLTEIKILPADHIALKNYDYVVGVEKKNKALQLALFAIIASGLIIIIYNKYNDEKPEK